MKMPNRTGSVCRLSGKRRRPWMARIYTPEGYAILGYYRLRSEALTALITAAGKPPEQKQSPTVTIQELWSLWSKTKQINHASLQAYRNAFNHLRPLWNRPIRFITVSEIEEAVRATDPAPTLRKVIKTMLGQMYRYAIAHDLADRNLAELIDIKKEIPPEKKVERKPFAPWEVAELFKTSDPYCQTVLVGIYTGMRPNELLSLCPAEIDLETQMLHIHGSKTKSGLFRHIPIHPAILSTITECLRKSAKFGATGLFYNQHGRRIIYDTYLDHIKDLGHTPHDTRHTFATYARASGLDPLATKRILGHVVSDLTESVYTHTDEAFLKREMRKFVIL